MPGSTRPGHLPVQKRLLFTIARVRQALDNVIARDAVERPAVVRVADLLARFYSGLEAAGITANEHVERFIEQQRANRELLTEPRFGVAGSLLDGVLETLDEFLANETALGAQRAWEGCIVEGHGDLRPGHICLSEPPVIIDCLEFNRALRLLDPFEELADLAAECERLGASWIGDILVDRCIAELGNRPPERLLAFYTAYRACQRARLAIRHLLDAEVREPEKWPPLARTYLEIADRACVTLRPRAGRRASRSRDSGE